MNNSRGTSKWYVCHTRTCTVIRAQLVHVIGDAHYLGDTIDDGWVNRTSAEIQRKRIVEALPSLADELFICINLTDTEVANWDQARAWILSARID